MASSPPMERARQASVDRGAGVILLYHRIAALERDPQLLCVQPKRFAEQLEVLRAAYSPTALGKLVAGDAVGSVQRPAVAVTFDDGYEDNLTIAAGLLESWDVPATVFVTTGAMDRGGEFWWDALERTLLAGEDGAIGWDVTKPDAPTPGCDAYRRLHPILKAQDAGVRAQALATLKGSGSDDVSSAARATHRPMTADQVHALSRSRCVEVGGHTVTHPVLSRLGLDRQREEIVNCRRRLTEIVGRPIDGFSYPYGTRRDFTRETADLVREAGFSYACANVPGLAAGGSGDAHDRYALPRVIVRDWDGDEFARRLAECLTHA